MQKLWISRTKIKRIFRTLWTIKKDDKINKRSKGKRRTFKWSKENFEKIIRKISWIKVFKVINWEEIIIIKRITWQKINKIEWKRDDREIAIKIIIKISKWRTSSQQIIHRMLTT